MADAAAKASGLAKASPAKSLKRPYAEYTNAARSIIPSKMMRTSQRGYLSSFQSKDPTPVSHLSSGGSSRERGTIVGTAETVRIPTDLEQTTKNETALQTTEEPVPDEAIVTAKESARVKALKLCAMVIENQRQLRLYNPDEPNFNGNNFSLVNSNDMARPTQLLFELQESFRAQGVDTHVDIGFHYTKSTNIEQIRSVGLLSEAERLAARIRSTQNGSSFGDGIYTGNNPFSYQAFAGSDQCLMVARLKGRTAVHGSLLAEGANTILGRAGDTDEVCVLKSSKQCVALIKFNASLISLSDDTSVGNIMVHRYHMSLQILIDKAFNEKGANTMVPLLIPSQVCLRAVAAVPAQPLIARVPYNAPEFLDELQSSALCKRKAADPMTDCSICLNPLTSGVVDLKACRHTFHEHCIVDSVKCSGKCPLCRKPATVPQGCMPSGTMIVENRPKAGCLGHGSDGAIVITYYMPAGIQKSYHVNPGAPFEATCRVAYIPNDREGRDLLKRLVFAFQHGLTFTVGTSLTTGQPNSITWASIHHKTSMHCEAHGYPDPSYFTNVNEELDSLHVPAADEL